MSGKRTLFILLGAIGLGAYFTRRHWIARLLALTSPKYDVVVERGVMIPVHDGTRLAADHYFPKSTGDFPTILMRTPYGRNENGGLLGALHTFLSQRFAERGYHVIIQDTRGAFDSEGEFEPFVDETSDGLETIDWVMHQPWFDGNLGMWGQSYGGYVQWAVAADAPDALKAMVLSITGSEITGYTGSAFTFDGMTRWIFNLNRAGRSLKTIGDDMLRYLNPTSLRRRLNRAFTELPISRADAIVTGKTLPYFQKWLAPENAHAAAPFWRSVAYGKRIPQVRASAHIIAGWYDIFLHGSLLDYAAMHAAGQMPYLTIGPWRHLDLACVAETLRCGIFWFEAVLKGRRRRLRANPVRIYVMGANEWREYADWSPAHVDTRFYLRSQNRLSMSETDSGFAPDRYRFDPADPTPSLGGPLYSPEAGRIDNRVLEARDDTLTYTTSPLHKDVEVIGHVALELYVRSTAPTFDIFARLCDVHPDGRSVNLCDGFIRNDPGLGEPQADGSLRIVVDMWATANRFRRGHSIRLMIASGAHPRLARNLGMLEPIATATRMQVAEQTIYHDSAHPSALVLPIIGDV